MTPPSKWLFFPSPASSGPTQTITWDMTGADTATVSSTGAAHINPSKTDQLAWSAGLPRFWNGAAAEDAANWSGSGYSFTSGTTCRDWWCLYAVSATLNGGSDISLNQTYTGGSGGSRAVDGAVGGACQAPYINISGSFAVKGSAFVSGDTVVFTVTAL